MMAMTMMWKSIIGVFLTLALVVETGAEVPATNKATSRNIKILNESGGKVEIHWIHPQTRAATLMSTPNVMNGASFPLNSYIGHEFEVRELPSTTTGVCPSEDQTCRTALFPVSGNADQSKSNINCHHACYVSLSIIT
jgi:hypothetical protein